MIDIKDLCKTLNGQKVLNCLNLFVPEGETLVILGRSGVCKSILLKNILGLMKPDQGMIEIAGTRIEHLNKDELYKVIQNMGMLFQGCALFDSLSIEENTAFYLTHHPNPKTGKPLIPFRTPITLEIEEILKTNKISEIVVNNVREVKEQKIFLLMI